MKRDSALCACRKGEKEGGRERGRERGKEGWREGEREREREGEREGEMEGQREGKSDGGREGREGRKKKNSPLHTTESHLYCLYTATLHHASCQNTSGTMLAHVYTCFEKSMLAQLADKKHFTIFLHGTLWEVRMYGK